MKRAIIIISTLTVAVVTMAAIQIPGVVQDHSITLTASVANYWPSTNGIDVADFQYFGYQMDIDEAVGNTPGATVTLQISNDKTTWTTVTQTCFYPATAAAAASVAIANETDLQGSIHPPACKYLRLVVTETNADDDDTFTCALFMQ